MSRPSPPPLTRQYRPYVDGILVTFSGSSEALARIVAGLEEPVNKGI
ncbi:MAG: hypothetical protein J6P72_00425 [Firmicutes bacterium]|nr:hypothetical protein [Bacillota bacterium]